MVHRREIGGTEIVLGNQGALLSQAMTWWDHGTGSVWSQPRGEAIAGPLRGERLELLPAVLTRWDAWRTDHPDTLALDAGGGTGGFDVVRMSIVVDFTTDVAAYPLRRVAKTGVANDVVAGAEIAVVVDPETPERWTVFARRVADRVVTLQWRGSWLEDVETGTTWDPVRGVGRSGPLTGETLGILPAFTAFPWDFQRLFPGGRVWEP